VVVTPWDPRKAFHRPDRTTLRVTVTITCPDGAAYSTVPRRVRLSTTPRPIVLGDLPSGGEILINGPYDGDLDVEVLNPIGVRLATLALRDVDLPTEDDFARILLDHPHAITRHLVDGTVTNVLSWRDLDASSPWWTPGLRHADRPRAQWQLLRLSAGDGWYTYPLAWAR
jgi:hypothetical protein